MMYHHSNYISVHIGNSVGQTRRPAADSCSTLHETLRMQYCWPFKKRHVAATRKKHIVWPIYINFQGRVLKFQKSGRFTIVFQFSDEKLPEISGISLHPGGHLCWRKLLGLLGTTFDFPQDQPGMVQNHEPQRINGPWTWPWCLGWTGRCGLTMVDDWKSIRVASRRVVPAPRE